MPVPALSRATWTASQPPMPKRSRSSLSRRQYRCGARSGPGGSSCSPVGSEQPHCRRCEHPHSHPHPHTELALRVSRPPAVRVCADNNIVNTVNSNAAVMRVLAACEQLIEGPGTATGRCVIPLGTSGPSLHRFRLRRRRQGLRSHQRATPVAGGGPSRECSHAAVL